MLKFIIAMVDSTECLTWWEMSLDSESGRNDYAISPQKKEQFFSKLGFLQIGLEMYESDPYHHFPQHGIGCKWQQSSQHWDVRAQIIKALL